MAHLWCEQAELDPGWAILTLHDPIYLLQDGLFWAAAGSEVPPGDQRPVLRRAAEHDWALFVPPDWTLRVNGQDVPFGMRVVADRDELALQPPGREFVLRYFFSTERLAQIEALPGREQPVICPRCKLAVEKESPAVQCPGCGAWHHQAPERGCWLYAERCSLCPQPTALDAGFRWTPEEL